MRQMVADGSEWLQRLRELHGRSRLWAVGIEAFLILVLLAVYRGGRSVIKGQELLARKNAEMVLEIQTFLHLPSEATIQSLFSSESFFVVMNTYYTAIHFPLMAVFLLWGFWRRPWEEYRWARNLIVIQTGAALVIHILFPLAPPRMFAQWGFIDTMTRYGPSPYAGASADLANQFAAMPSLHVGWAVLIAYVVTRTGRRPLASLAWAHAGLTTFIVVVTANHWWLDAVVGVMLLVLADRLVRRPTQDADPSPVPVPATSAQISASAA